MFTFMYLRLSINICVYTSVGGGQQWDGSGRTIAHVEAVLAAYILIYVEMLLYIFEQGRNPR